MVRLFLFMIPTVRDERFAMAKKVYTLKEVVDLQIESINEEKQITLELLGKENFTSMAEKINLSEAALREIFARTLRRALMFSSYPDEGSYTIEQYAKMVENLK